ncbi:hypothetical protein Nepgr_003847 [Nepenthes gracilis]|uniref:Uncharacterized protein n=1 Tax=Nepenthes gracilis TaxID=150966 RepID=A0AAD3XE99_NEPGR|nr:hypothetical protein Nepgr_003847 [Nepenthes gracilis]
MLTASLAYRIRFFDSFWAIVALQQFAFCCLILRDLGTLCLFLAAVHIFFGNELEDGVLCRTASTMVLFGLFKFSRTVIAGNFIKLPIVCGAVFSLKWPFSFDTVGRPHLPPETDLAPVVFRFFGSLLVLPEMRLSCR